MALANFMRLSLPKAVHADMGGAAPQEIRVRSGRDDKGNLGARPYHFVAGTVTHVLEHLSLTFVIPTGAKRSGGTCGFLLPSCAFLLGHPPIGELKPSSPPVQRLSM